MNLQDFITECELPLDWEPIVRMEALTGCSTCERRLIQDDKLKPGTAAVRMYSAETGKLEGVFVLCKTCAPKQRKKP
jgi:hypothetical protein